ncbi:MAG: 50S ribosomal protein L16 [Candidatus Nanoarchaeia archaeon]|nr:50S ribosomal protein L16 [Candidatus Nanoarchaeia archaeon]
MVVVRKALAYSKRKPVVNTRRSKIQQLSYVKMVPSQKIVKFFMGDIKGFNDGKYNIRIDIISLENVQIRDLSLEATRQSLHKDFSVDFPNSSYYLRCNAYPHNILRNNRVYSGGSKGERIQTGMSKSFGSPEGRAAVIKAGKSVFTAYFNGENNIPKARAICKKTTPKLPCATKIVATILKKA